MAWERLFSWVHWCQPRLIDSPAFNTTTIPHSCGSLVSAFNPDAPEHVRVKHYNTDDENIVAADSIQPASGAETTAG